VLGGYGDAATLAVNNAVTPHAASFEIAKRNAIPMLISAVLVMLLLAR
jgi:hypothetical protein